MSPRMYMYPSFYASYMYVHVLRTCLVVITTRGHPA